MGSNQNRLGFRVADNAHTEITGLSVPTRKTECEMIAGGTPAEAAANLASRIAKLT
jgi:hypothetical protein